MPRKKRNFSSKFKSDLVIEVLKGEKDLTALATENSILPNLLRKWKTEFLEKAHYAFDGKNDDKLREQVASLEKANNAYARKVGQLTIENDWLKKKSEEEFGPSYEDFFSNKPSTD